MTRTEMIEYIAREARVAAEQMLDKNQPIHLFDFGVVKDHVEVLHSSYSVMIVIGETDMLETWAMLMGRKTPL